MDQVNDYFKNVEQWSKEWRKFLHSQEVNEKEEVWKKLDEFTNRLQQLNKFTIHEDSIRKIQSEVENLQNEMENYFAKRKQIGSIFVNTPSVPIGGHQLPPLPYPYNGLEPYISEEIMKLHHTKHHQSYVDGLNKAEKKLAEARKSGDFSLVKHWSRELAFHGSGHYLHTIFWNNMSPKGGGKPTGKLFQQIETDFGNFEAFKKHFTEAAKAVEGVGWALLVWSPRSRRLEILQSERHMDITQWDTIPLLVLDVWEHAYYLQYKNDRGKYINNWWNVVNWDDVHERYKKASQLTWKMY